MFIQELKERILGFMPEYANFWYSVGFALIVIVIQLFNKWLVNVTELPWMKDENQQIRDEILNNIKKGKE